MAEDLDSTLTTWTRNRVDSSKRRLLKSIGGIMAMPPVPATGMPATGIAATTHVSKLGSGVIIENGVSKEELSISLQRFVHVT